MNLKCRVYCAAVIAAGFATAALALLQFNGADAARLLVYTFSAVLFAATKIRIPGLTATISGASLLMFSAIADMPLADTVVIVLAAGVAQSFLNALRRPRAVQVAFSAAALVIGAALSFVCAHRVAAAFPAAGGIAPLLTAALSFFLVNTVLIAGVLSLTQGESATRIWKRLYLWTFPCHIVSALLGGLLGRAAAHANWQAVIFFMPALCLIYLYAQTVVKANMPVCGKEA